MPANSQTLGGSASTASTPSTERADTTSTNTGGKRKTPANASTLSTNGGKDWTREDERRLWSYRHQQGDVKFFGAIGNILGRTAQACRLRHFNLLAIYRTKGYEKTFGQPRPAGLEEPPAEKVKASSPSKANGSGVKEKAARSPKATTSGVKKRKSASSSKTTKSGAKKGKVAAADRTLETVDHHLAKEDPARLSGAELVHLASANTAGADARLRAAAFREHNRKVDEADGRVARGCVQFRGEGGLRAEFENNKTTEYADPKKRARVEEQRDLVGLYQMPVPGQETGQETAKSGTENHGVDPLQLRDLGELLKLPQGTGARLSANPQFAGRRNYPQDPRMSLDRVTNDN